MNRRAFFAAAGSLLAVPVAPRRVFSFLWDNPLVQVASPGIGLYDAEPIPLSTKGWLLDTSAEQPWQELWYDASCASDFVREQDRVISPVAEFNPDGTIRVLRSRV